MAGWGKRWSALPNRAPSSPASSKHRNVKTEVDGRTFASKKEAEHYQQLKLRALAGEIRKLATQVPFCIMVNDIHICDYVADFVYEEKVGQKWGAGKFEEVWERRVVDAKGQRLPIYRLKKKLMKAVLGIEVIEI